MVAAEVTPGVERFTSSGSKFPLLERNRSGGDSLEYREHPDLILSRHNQQLDLGNPDRTHRVGSLKRGYRSRHFLGERAYPMDDIRLDRLFFEDPREEGAGKETVFVYNPDDEFEGVDFEELLHFDSFWVKNSAEAYIPSKA